MFSCDSNTGIATLAEEWNRIECLHAPFKFEQILPCMQVRIEIWQSPQRRLQYIDTLAAAMVFWFGSRRKIVQQGVHASEDDREDR